MQSECIFSLTIAARYLHATVIDVESRIQEQASGRKSAIWLCFITLLSEGTDTSSSVVGDVGVVNQAISGLFRHDSGTCLVALECSSALSGPFGSALEASSLFTHTRLMRSVRPQRSQDDARSLHDTQCLYLIDSVLPTESRK